MSQRTTTPTPGDVPTGTDVVRTNSAQRAPVLERLAQFWTLGVLVVLVIAFGIAAPEFISQAAWLATSVSATTILLLAIGQTFVISTGGIDLSVGSVLSVSGMVGGYVMHQQVEGGSDGWTVIALGLACAIVTGLVAGLINGLVITRMNVSPLIATLGMLGAAGGVANLIGEGRQISGLPLGLSDIGFTNVGGWLPVPVLVAFVVTAIAWYVLAKTRFGRRALAIGSNSESVGRAGVSVKGHLVRVYVLSGFFASIAGFLVMSRLSAASPTAGTSSELMSIAAVVIGGSSLFGGRSSVVGTLIGTFVIAVMQTGLIVAGVDPFWQVIAVGIILVLAVWADQQRVRLVNRA